MNKYYDINESRKSNCTYIGSVESENDRIADSFVSLICAMIGFFCTEGFRTALRVICTVACFIGFVGIIGSVESGAMTVGNGIIFAVFMIFIELLCFVPGKSSK